MAYLPFNEFVHFVSNDDGFAALRAQHAKGTANRGQRATELMGEHRKKLVFTTPGEEKLFYPRRNKSHETLVLRDPDSVRARLADVRISHNDVIVADGLPHVESIGSAMRRVSRLGYCQ
jgi:hypothetical protein